MAAGAGIRGIVVVSSGAVTAGYDTTYHLPVELAVRESGLGWTIVRPGEFAMNSLLRQQVEAISAAIGADLRIDQVTPEQARDFYHRQGGVSPPPTPTSCSASRATTAYRTPPTNPTTGASIQPVLI